MGPFTFGEHNSNKLINVTTSIYIYYIILNIWFTDVYGSYNELVNSNFMMVILV